MWPQTMFDLEVVHLLYSQKFDLSPKDNWSEKNNFSCGEDCTP